MTVVSINAEAMGNIALEISIVSYRVLLTDQERQKNGPALLDRDTNEFCPTYTAQFALGLPNMA